jgi:putative ABC transport system permease protein
MPETPLSLKLYRLLLKLYPAGFREEYAKPMEREFRDELAESTGVFALTKLWLRLLADLSISLPQQLAREVVRDLKHTLRLWANRPLHTGFAILALAIGIGANTGVFSVVNALLLRSLPFDDPSHLASTQTYLVPHDSAQQFHGWRQQSAYLADAALVEEADFNIGIEPDVLHAHIAQASWNFFQLLGTRPVLGRTFNPDEDTHGRNAVAVISYGLWQQLFAGNQRVLGSTVRVLGTPVTIIGVAPPGFNYPNNTVLWKAAQFGPGNNGWETLARLKPGVTWPQASAAFTAEMDRLAPPGILKRRSATNQRRLISLQDELAGSVKQASLLLLAGVLLILFIACANVANLLLARTADRATELSIRSALGASRARLMQQLLTECLLLSCVAATAGLLIGYWATSLAAKVLPAPLTAQSYSILDGRVLAFSACLALLSGLLFGVLPAFNAGRVHSFGVRGDNGLRGSRLIRETLVAAQVMLTIMLLAASVTVGRAFVKLLQLDRGFDARGLVTVGASLQGTTHEGAGRQLAYFDQALARIRGVAGVQSVSAAEVLPLFVNGMTGGPFGLDGRPPKTNSMTVHVLPGYFQTMRGRILYGREFTDAEARSDAKVVVVTETFARQFGDAADTVGHQVTQGQRPPWKIVGVVRGMDYMVRDGNVSQLFFPAALGVMDANAPGVFFSAFVVRVAGRAEEHVALVRDALRAVDPHVPIFGAKTMEQRLNEALARPDFYRTALLFFAGFALLLAVIGIYGVVSYAVAQRTREMGVRLALGATPNGLRSLLLGQGLVPVATGALLGVCGAVPTGSLLNSLVDGAKPLDPGTFLFLLLLIILVAATGIWAGSRRIAGLDIMEVLRVE